MFKIFAQLFYYEMLFFVRDRQLILHSLAFFVLVTLLFPLALAPHPELLQKFAPGILWVAALLASLLALDNWLRTEMEDQALEQLLMSVHPLAWLLFAKLVAFAVVVTVPLLVVLPLLGLVLHLPIMEMLVLGLSLLLGVPSLLAIGATCRSLTLSLPQQGALLALLILPLTLPLLLMGVNALLEFRLNVPIGGTLAFLAGVMVLCFCFLPLGMGAVLRWGQS